MENLGQEEVGGRGGGKCHLWRGVEWDAGVTHHPLAGGIQSGDLSPFLEHVWAKRLLLTESCTMTQFPFPVRTQLRWVFGGVASKTGGSTTRGGGEGWTTTH